jgi:biotin operon repressor
MSSYHGYADSDRWNIEESKLKLINALPEGRENALSGKDIAQSVPQSYSTVRDMLPELRSQYGIPVGACSDGYYIVTSPDELERQIERYDSQIETAQTRKQELVEAFNTQRYE